MCVSVHEFLHDTLPYTQRTKDTRSNDIKGFFKWSLYMSAYEKTLKPKIKPIEHAFETTLN